MITFSGCTPLDETFGDFDVSLYDEDGKRLACYRTVDDARRARALDAHLLIDEIRVAGAPFTARLQFWSRPDQEWRVTLRRPKQASDDAVFVTAQELSGDELLTLLVCLGRGAPPSC